jgi:hypothetical protein
MRRRSAVLAERPPMWVLSYAHWREFRGVPEPERFVLHTQAVDGWIAAQGDRRGFDPFDDEGAFEIEAAEAAIRRGEVW